MKPAGAVFKGNLTPAMRSTLEALKVLGRRRSHTIDDVANQRLMSQGKLVHTYQQRAAYKSATERKVYTLVYFDLVESMMHKTQAGNLPLIYGPFFKITKEGQKVLKKR